MPGGAVVALCREVTKHVSRRRPPERLTVRRQIPLMLNNGSVLIVRPPSQIWSARAQVDSELTEIGLASGPFQAVGDAPQVCVGSSSCRGRRASRDGTRSWHEWCLLQLSPSTGRWSRAVEPMVASAVRRRAS